MTLKQYNTIKLLPKNKYNISKSMKEAGYTKQSSQAGANYERLRKHLKAFGFYDKDGIEKDSVKVYKQAQAKGDITNQCRLIEHRAKVAGMIVDKAHIDNKNPDKIVIVYDKERKPDHIDTPQPASDKDSK